MTYLDCECVDMHIDTKYEIKSIEIMALHKNNWPRASKDNSIFYLYHILICKKI